MCCIYFGGTAPAFLDDCNNQHLQCDEMMRNMKVLTMKVLTSEPEAGVEDKISQSFEKIL